jgi:transcriptional regulator with XRE-family HTH domain
MYGIKIRMVRELRGLSQENVAQRLGIAQNTYSGYENNQIKISAEMLQKVAEVLDVSPMDLMSQQPAIINLQSNHGTQGIAHIENFYSMQKDLVDKMLQAKDEEIARLQKMVDAFMAKR